MKAKVHVSLKAGVLDPQGKAVGDALGRLGRVLQAGITESLGEELLHPASAAHTAEHTGGAQRERAADIRRQLDGTIGQGQCICHRTIEAGEHLAQG